VTFNVASTYQFRATATDAVGNVSVPVSSPANHVSLSDDNSGVPKFSGSWSTQKGNAISAGAYGNTVHEATAPQPGKPNTVTFTFTGTEVALLAAVGSDRGQVTMSVDGGAAQTIALYAPSQQQAVVAGTVSGLTLGSHTATVNVLGSRNPASTGTRVDLDAFVAKF
jgi:alpha-L-fucosidase 2